MLANGGWDLTLILLTWTTWRAPTNASKWRMGFNSTFKGLKGCCWKLKPSEMWRCVYGGGGVFTDVSKHQNASFFRVKQFNMIHWPWRKRQYDIEKLHKLLAQWHNVICWKTLILFLVSYWFSLPFSKVATNWWLFWDRLLEYTNL